MRRLVLPLLLVFCGSLPLAGQNNLPAQTVYNNYPLGPDSRPQPGVPKGIERLVGYSG